MAKKIKERKYKKDGTVGTYDYKFTGEEPTWADWKSLSLEDFQNRRHRIFGFYAYYLDGDDYKAILLEWMKNNKYSKGDMELLAKIPKTSVQSTCAKIARAINMGMPAMHPKDKVDFSLYVKEGVREMIAEVQRNELTKEVDADVAAAAKTKPRVLTIEERVDHDIISHLEKLMDEWFNENPNEMRVKGMDLQHMMKLANIPSKQGIPLVLAWLKKNLEEFKEAYDRTDLECAEGYSYMKRPALRNRINEMLLMIGSLESVAKSSTKEKKVKEKVVRKKKEKPPEKLIARLKFLEKSKEYGDSVDPKKIIGASEVIVFNTKYRTFSHYYAIPGKGLTVQGSSLKNFDPENSYTMALRKPLETLPVLQGSAKGKILTTVKKLTTKPRKANGRINDMTLIINTLK